MLTNYSILCYEDRKTFSDECEFAGRGEAESCNHTSSENVLQTSNIHYFMSQGVKMGGFRARSARKRPIMTPCDIN